MLDVNAEILQRLGLEAGALGRQFLGVEDVEVEGRLARTAHTLDFGVLYHILPIMKIL